MTRKLKIVHTEASNGWGGQEIRTFTEAQWFRRRGHEVIIAGPCDGQLIERAKEANMRVFEIPFAKNTQRQDFLRFKQYLQTERPDVLATHSSVDSWVGLFAGAWTHVPCRLRYRHISAPVRKNPFNRIQYNRLCHHILTTGECIRQPLIDRIGVKPNRIDVVATGLVFPKTLPDREQARRNLAEQLQLPAESHFLGNVAVLRSWKGQTYVMEAFEQVAASFPQYHLVVVGEGPMRKVLEEQVQHLKFSDRIHMVGYQTDVWRYFRAFDLALLVSYQNEGIPQSGLQSLYAETPLIGTTVGGIPEIIEDGKNGYLVEPGNATAIAEGIRHLLDNPQKRAELAGRTRASMQAVYNIDTMGNRVLGIIQTVLDRNGRGRSSRF